MTNLSAVLYSQNRPLGRRLDVVLDALGIIMARADRWLNQQVGHFDEHFAVYGVSDPFPPPGYFSTSNLLVINSQAPDVST